jgi:hypothetical protein
VAWELQSLQADNSHAQEYSIAGSADAHGMSCRAMDGWASSFCQGPSCAQGVQSEVCTSGPSSSVTACKAACDSTFECTAFLYNEVTPWNDGSWCVMYHDEGALASFAADPHITYDGDKRWGSCHYFVPGRDGGNAIVLPWGGGVAPVASSLNSYTCYVKSGSNPPIWTNGIKLIQTDQECSGTQHIAGPDGSYAMPTAGHCAHALQTHSSFSSATRFSWCVGGSANCDTAGQCMACGTTAFTARQAMDTYELCSDQSPDCIYADSWVTIDAQSGQTCHQGTAVNYTLVSCVVG